MEIARYWRMNSQRYNLKGTICAHCGRLSFSPRVVCAYCQNESATSQRLRPQSVYLSCKAATSLSADIVAR